MYISRENKSDKSRQMQIDIQIKTHEREKKKKRQKEICGWHMNSVVGRAPYFDLKVVFITLL